VTDREVRDFELRELDRRGFLRATLLASAGGALLAAGCGSDDGGETTATATAGSASPVTTAAATPATVGSADTITPNLLTQEFVAGKDNRFAVGLLTGNGKLVKADRVQLRFFTIDDKNLGSLRGEGDARYVELNVTGAHQHDGSTGDALTSDSVSFYVANTPFDVAGKWGVVIEAWPSDGSTPKQVSAAFNVGDKAQSPAVGSVPPASMNDTFATNTNTESLCSRTPACPLHDKVIGDLLGKGRPLVVMFSTPAFCTSRFCGPVLEVLLEQVPAYQDRIDFVHIEVWQDFQLQKHRPATDEWQLPTEPYTFFMDKNGVILGKVEAVFGQDELKSSLDQLAQ
jgi:hypothetical protein